jgi:MoaA/NifB/PqqE/SkfB family radical SAM enzyme
MTTDKYLMDGHKMLWHLDRVLAWQRGERIAPLHIDAGLSKGCNIRCEYCFGVLQGNFYRRGADRVFPREPLLRYVRDAGAAGVRSMGFIGEGEPLLNPAVYDAVVAARRAGMDIALATNGILLDAGRACDRALECLSWLRFNLSAASADAFLRVHRSRDFDVVTRKIRHVVARKHRRRLKVTIGLQMVLTPNNIDQAIPLAQLGRELGVDYCVIKQCSDTVSSELGVHDKLAEYASFESILRAAEAESRGAYHVIVKWKKVMNRGERSYRRCLGAPFLLYSSGDGRLYPCGMFFDRREREFRMGDLVKQSFTDILRSERYWNIVEKVKTLDVRRCYSNCRTHCINEFLWQLTHPPEHVNFV